MMSDQGFQDIEAQAFHAYREWPVWLILRQKELQQQGAEVAAPVEGDTASTQHGGGV